MERIHREQFRRCVMLHGGDHRVRRLSCREQFLCMSFAQMTFRDSLRDIESCLNARPELRYHMGFRNRIARSTLADANESRDFRIYADLGQKLIAKARKLYAGEELELDLTNAAYALDSTTVTVSLGLFPWARFKKGMAGVKVHTQLDLRGSIPAFVDITAQRVHDINFLDRITPEPDAIYIMDRAYKGLARLHRFHQNGAFFVVRAFKTLDFARSRSLPKTDPRVRSDHLGHPRNFRPRRLFPDLLRKIRFVDPERGIELAFLTNLITANASDIARLYKYRWQIELFFKWIKQNLRIRSFFGNSLNAVQTQIWIAICVYVLVAIIRKELHLDLSLHRILQILSVTPFEKVPLTQLLTQKDTINADAESHNQLSFKDF